MIKNNVNNMQTGYILIADILGFSNIISNLDDKKLSERVEEWINLVRFLTAKHEIESYQLLSDTIFVAINGTETEHLTKIIEFGKTLLNESLKIDIPIKGAITYGSFSWGELIYGKPIIEAHNLEMNQNWIGITLNSGIPHAEECFNINTLVTYPTPMKKGVIKLYPVIVWDDYSFEDLSKMTVNRGLAMEGEHLSWPWAEKIRNTAEFFLYLKFLKSQSLSCDKFYGLSPIQSIGTSVVK